MKSKIIDYLAYGFVALYTIAASLVSLHRFWQYEVFYYDFGIYDQAIWNIAHFRPPVIDHFVIGGKWIFADHFGPSIFLLSPVYWVTDRPEAMLIAQAVLAGLSGLVIYALARHVLKRNIASFGITAAYLMFIGLQNALISDIHDVTFMVLPLSLTLYAFAKRRMTLFWISFLITLGFKESTGFLGMGIAMLIFVTERSWRKTALYVAAVSILWSIATTQWIIPYFYGRRYFYTPTWDANPITLLWMFFDDPQKRRTVFYSLMNFGFFPIFYPPSWPMIIQDLATRFLQKDFTLRWGLGLHYSTQMAVILAYASVMGLSSVAKKFRYKAIIPVAGILLVLIAAVLHRFILRGPLGLSYNPAFYANTKNFGFLNNLISRVPKGATVMTMNNIAPHMLHTHHVYLLRAVYDDYLPEYFVLDLRSGQNFNNFFGADIEALKLTLPKDTRYEEFYKNGDQVIYKRKI